MRLDYVTAAKSYDSLSMTEYKNSLNQKNLRLRKKQKNTDNKIWDDDSLELRLFS